MEELSSPEWNERCKFWFEVCDKVEAGYYLCQPRNIPVDLARCLDDLYKSCVFSELPMSMEEIFNFIVRDGRRASDLRLVDPDHMQEVLKVIEEHQIQGVTS